MSDVQFVVNLLLGWETRFLVNNKLLMEIELLPSWENHYHFKSGFLSITQIASWRSELTKGITVVMLMCGRIAHQVEKELHV